MTDRRNLCINPAAKNDNTGWGTGSAQATGLTGFPRTTGARFTSGTFQETAKTGAGATVPGLTYTLSCYIKALDFNANTADLYALWPSGGFSLIASGGLTAGVVTRRSGTITAAGSATQLWLGLDGINSAANRVEITGVLIEAASALDTYFDGDSADATWDGASGNSSSTLHIVSGVVLPELSGRLSATGRLSGLVTPSGRIAGRLTPSGRLSGRIS